MTTLALQMMEEIRDEVQAKLAAMQAWSETQDAPAGAKYAGREFATVPPVNMQDLALANCPSFVVPRHFIFPG